MSNETIDQLLPVLKALAHESRLRLLGLLATDEYTVSALAERLNLKEPTVSHHLAKLHSVGFVQMRVEGTAHYYRLDQQAIQRLNRGLLSETQVAQLADDVVGEPWERKVLQTYLIDGQLTKIPDTRKKRDVILRWLVRQFATDTRYPEPELNAIIKRIHPDTATLRRELVGARLMQRENGIYWRVPEQA